MIDFRYHLVSIVAVFLALAIGIVVGSTALKPAVLTTLQKTATAEKKRIDALYAQNRQYQNELGAAQAYAQAGEHLALNGLLDGQRVVLVTAPGFPGGVVTGVSSALAQAGATVSGQVQLQSQFFAAGTQSNLDTLNRQLTPVGVTLRAGTEQAQAAELIASAILTKDGPADPPAGIADASGKSILRGYAAGGFLSTSGNPAARATLAVVIIPGTPPATSGAAAASQTLVTVAQELNLAGNGTVVAGPAAVADPEVVTGPALAGPGAGVAAPPEFPLHPATGATLSSSAAASRRARHERICRAGRLLSRIWSPSGPTRWDVPRPA